MPKATADFVSIIVQALTLVSLARAKYFGLIDIVK